ncbi:glycoside hydrolase family 32 protein [Paenibacillus sp. MCAF20]
MKHTYNHPLRPQFHFTPEAHWLNDPNGMVYFDGEYHLFYQHHPESTVWGPMHWGHAISRDLVRWEHQPIALYPDRNGTIFSGSAVVDWHDTSGFFDGGAGLVAIYTQTEMIEGSDQSKQRQSIAYSRDNGRTWIAFAGNPVLADERCPDFRDPKVFWHEASKHWVMVLAAGDRLFLYTWMDHGRDNYAGVTWSDAPGNGEDRLLIGWMNNWKYANLIPTGEWRGAMTLPRKLSLEQRAGGIRLIQHTLDALDGLRLGGTEWSDLTIESGHNQLLAEQGELLEMAVEFELGTAAEFGIKLKSGTRDDVEYETIVGYDAAAGELFIDRTKAGDSAFHPQFACKHGASLAAPNGRVKLRLWVDRSSVELFADEGGLVMTDQLFPHAGNDSIELYATGGSVRVVSLQYYPLQSVYASSTTKETVQK